MISFPRNSPAALGLFVGMLALGAWAQPESDGHSCRVVQAQGAPAQLEPVGERTQHTCSVTWCAGLNRYDLGYSHSVTCLYVTDPAGTPTGTFFLGNDMNGPQRVRFAADNRVELSFSTREGSWDQVYEISADGRLTPPPPPPPLSARQRREQEARGRKADADHARRVALEERSGCQQLDSEPSCGSWSPSEEERQRLGQVCGPPTEDVLSVCSKAGCVGLVRRRTEEQPSYCMAWAPRKGPAILVSKATSDLRALVVDGSVLCLNKVQACNGWTGFTQDACVDVSGPVARPVTVPSSGASGNAEYGVLPYRGPAPLVDGKAREPEWKAPPLMIETAALVSEGLEAWRDARDASAEWIFRSRGEELLFLLRVRDDQVLVGQTPEHGDGVRLSFSPSPGGERSESLGLLLAPEGKVHTSGTSHARCAWSGTADGYRMECAIPLADLKLPKPPSTWRVGIEVEDRDGPGEPLTRLSTVNRLVAWSEFPPTWAEMTELTSWEPCEY